MEEQRFPTPTWAQEVMEKYRSGVAHAFILHFNIHDYAAGTMERGPGKAISSSLSAPAHRSGAGGPRLSGRRYVAAPVEVR